ncbi:zinc finger protein zelda [Rhynchophorus ferrugineus]|uniref:zinc finger protein zelda n=1 Tax=Rhynchophorus ferrugineus TaxID=354439 RepID=UPI003FCD8DD0
MANSTANQYQQPYQCKECGLLMNSAESLDVHLQYHHKETIMHQWPGKTGGSAGATTTGDEKNNNMTKLAAAIKREFPGSNTVAAVADSSDTQKRSPEYHRTTPDGSFAQPPTPQSYHSGSSEYQNSAFSPNFQNFPGKSEGNSPVAQQHQQQPHFQNAFSAFADQQQFYSMQEANNSYAQELNMPNHSVHNNGRYHPYGQNFERPKSQCGQSASSPVYPPQPTPSPSPKQCDKCGYVCESGAQLIEHTNLSHPNTHQYAQANQHFMFEQQGSLKEEECSQSEILDLDSHKVVHPVWPHVSKEDDKRPDGGGPPNHSISAMLGSWPTDPHHQQPQQQQSQQQPPPGMYQNEHSMYIGDGNEHKMFPNMSDGKMFSPGQKIFQPHQIAGQNFINSGVSSSTGADMAQQSYRPFEHLPTSGAPAITSSQVPQVPPVNTAAPTPPTTKSTNWKSNEARRPKTYNCSACNKWFTSSGHLKRHYNTTLHKNAVKSSGLPDPATLPISAHHHPSRESSSNKDDHRSHSGSPREDSRVEDANSMGSPFEGRMGGLPGILQHGSYDRQGGPPGMHHGPPGHSPLGQHHAPLGNHNAMMQGASFTALSNGGSPNGEAPLSSPDSRGLLSMAPATHSSFNMVPQTAVMPAMEASQFQMYPNESAPHVTQVMAITSNSTTGELQYVQQNNQPLPSFAQLQTRRFGGGYANVGGLGPVTASLSTYFSSEEFDLNDTGKNIFVKDEFGGKLGDAMIQEGHQMIQVPHPQEMEHYSPTVPLQYSPTATNNNHDAANSLAPLYTIQLSGMQPLSVTTDIQSESKENYAGPESNSPKVTSTVVNQDEHKTKCYDCDKVFNRPCYLTQHNKTCHNGEKPFKCVRCGKRYATEEKIEQHIRKHLGSKPHKCADCPKEFNHKTDLRRHRCCHTGKKPYPCSICGKGFIRKDHMVKHMETHNRGRKADRISAMRN